MGNKTITNTYKLGGMFILGFFLSYIVNKSILWAVLHGVVGFVYAIYWTIVYSGQFIN